MKNLIKLFLGLLITVSAIMASGQTFNNYTTAQGLPDNNVNGVAIDQNNNKWFGTQTGVAKFDGSAWSVYTTAQGVIDNYINCIAVDNDNHVWVGTDIGVSMFNGTTWTSFTTLQGLVNNQVNYISADPDGKVWFSTSGGVSVYDGTNWTSYTSASGLPSDMTSYIAPDTQGNTWVGTWIGGLAKFNGTTFQVFTIDDSLTSNNIIAIALQDNSYKWIGTYSGISVFDNSDHWVRNYRTADGMYNNYVQDMHFDSQGNLWIGMYADYLQDGGITVYTGSHWYSYSVAEGLVNAQVKRLAIDQQDNIWIATGNGVSELINPVTGVTTLKENQGFRIYPNPADKFFRIEHTGSASVEILDLTGKTACSTTLKPEETTVDIRNLVSGIYFLKIKTDNNSSCSKLIVK
jgi:ligand-binding sensor domain-containing protein